MVSQFSYLIGEFLQTQMLVKKSKASKQIADLQAREFILKPIIYSCVMHPSEIPFNQVIEGSDSLMSHIAVEILKHL